MFDLIHMNMVLLFGFASLAVLTGGIVKGAVGFALPLVAMSLLTLVMSPKLALAGMVLSYFVTNARQALRFGFSESLVLLKRYWRLNLTLYVFLAIFAQLIVAVSEAAVVFMLGAVLTVFALLQLFGVSFRIPEKRQAIAQWISGTTGGMIGGLTGLWGPPIIIYFTAAETEKREMATAIGVTFFLGTVVLTLSHLKSGLLNMQTLPLSAWLAVVAVIGQQTGFAIQDRLDQKRFTRIVQVVLLLAGLNLIRRALM